VSDNETVPRRRPGLPIRLVKAEVTEGPDEGKSAIAAGDALSIGTAQGNDLILTDPTVSRYHLELAPARGGIAITDHDSTNGTRLGGARLTRAVVPTGTTLTLGDSRVAVSEGGNSEVVLHEDDKLHGIRGKTPVMRRLMAQVERAAPSGVSVLILGESGTGKELVARALHEASGRAGKPFVTVDCGSLSPNLVASELFGHERGAFTGATQQHKGAFERADGGTVFLDEIGEIPLPLQANLLGVLERKRFKRVGGSADIEVDVRVISATHHDLRGDVNAGSFRLDLYYRLAVVTLAVPSLSERSADIPLLVEHFLRTAGWDGPVGAVVDAATMTAFSAHRWPGNVRELRNAVEAMLAMGENTIAQGTGVAPADAGDSIGRVLEQPYKEARAAVLADFEGRYLRDLLDRAGGNVSEAARIGRMNRSHLTELLRRHRTD
jgi:DNA-binding NtrC family response regulator